MKRQVEWQTGQREMQLWTCNSGPVNVGRPVLARLIIRVCEEIGEGLGILGAELAEYSEIEGVIGLSEGAGGAEVMIRLPGLDEAAETSDLLVTTVTSLPSLETDKDGTEFGWVGRSVDRVR